MIRSVHLSVGLSVIISRKGLNAPIGALVPTVSLSVTVSATLMRRLMMLEGRATLFATEKDSSPAARLHKTFTDDGLINRKIGRQGYK